MPYPPNDISTSGLPSARGGSPSARRTSSCVRDEWRAMNGMSRVIGSSPAKPPAIGSRKRDRRRR